MGGRTSKGRWTLAAVVLLATAAWQSAASSSPEARRAAVEQGLAPAVVIAGRPVPAWTIDARMRRYHVPGISIAVIDNGAVDWAQGYGVKRAGSTDAVLPTTMFQAASISKPVAAACALRLVQDGRLSLDEDVNRRLRSWRVPATEHTARSPITLRRLLSHTAGTTVHGFVGYSRGSAVPSLVQVLEGAGPANSAAVRVEADPGSRYKYSGGGYQILELLIEDTMRRPFADVARDLVLAPIGMEASTFEQPLPESRAAAAAAGHEYDGSVLAGDWHVHPERAAAGLWTTPGDVARFAIELMHAARGQSAAVLNQHSMRAMLTAVSANTGLGVGLHGRGERRYFDHSGANRGYRAYFLAYPETGDGAVIMTNGEGGQTLIQEVLRSIARVYGWPEFGSERRTVKPVPAAALDSLAGEYLATVGTFRMTVAREGDHLIVGTPRGTRFTFYPSGDREFFAIEDGTLLNVIPKTQAGHELQIFGLHTVRRPPAAEPR